MPAFWDKLITFIEQNIRICSWNKELLDLESVIYAFVRSSLWELSDLGISLLVFPSRTNLKLHGISVTPKMVKKVITNFDLSKTFGPDSIPVVVLKNCDTKLSYRPGDLFNKCLKESFFQGCWKVSSVVHVECLGKNVWERSTAKNYHPISLLSLVSKVYEKLVNNKIIDHLEKCNLFVWCLVWF